MESIEEKRSKLFVGKMSKLVHTFLICLIFILIVQSDLIQVSVKNHLAITFLISLEGHSKRFFPEVEFFGLCVRVGKVEQASCQCEDCKRYKNGGFFHCCYL